MLKGIYSLNLLYANGKFKFIGFGQEMQEMSFFFFPHWRRAESLVIYLNYFSCLVSFDYTKIHP